MATDNVTGVTSTTSSGTSSDSMTNAAQQVLGKDDFLKLLITELKYQDPLSPVDNKAFISEMAQFSSLEQLQNMNDNFSNLVTLQNLSQMNFAVNLVNHRVIGADASGTKVDGLVTNVSMDSGEPSVIVGTSSVSMKDIIKIY
jgi:flagellar basal-body rod modification protein FlgD